MQCPFCKEEIQDGAIKCKHCGSMISSGESLKTASKPSIEKVMYAEYSQVPWFRKNWFAVVCLLIFMPALLFILITGDIYYEKKGQLLTYGKGAKTFLIILSALSLLYIVVSILKG